MDFSLSSVQMQYRQSLSVLKESYLHINYNLVDDFEMLETFLRE